MCDSFRRGLRLGTPFAAVALVLSLSFGVLVVQAGFTPLQAIVTSALAESPSAVTFARQKGTSDALTGVMAWATAQFMGSRIQGFARDGPGS